MEFCKNSFIHHCYQSLTFLYSLRQLFDMEETISTNNSSLQSIQYSTKDIDLLAQTLVIQCFAKATQPRRTGSNAAIILLIIWEHPSHFPTFVVAFDCTYACIMEDQTSLLLSSSNCNLARFSSLQSIQ